MRFMLMMNAPRGTGDYQVSDWRPEDFKAHIEFMHSLNKELKEAGELVTGEGLAAPGEAKLVRANKSGGAPVTDGVFPESKEYLAGFWIVDVDNAERAYAIAAQISDAPGPGGKPLIIPVEVRQVMQAPPTT
jgi:hypothetical protein